MIRKARPFLFAALIALGAACSSRSGNSGASSTGSGAGGVTKRRVAPPRRAAPPRLAARPRRAARPPTFDGGVPPACPGQRRRRHPHRHGHDVARERDGVHLHERRERRSVRPGRRRLVQGDRVRRGLQRDALRHGVPDARPGERPDHAVQRRHVHDLRGPDRALPARRLLPRQHRLLSTDGVLGSLHHGGPRLRRQQALVRVRRLRRELRDRRRHQESATPGGSSAGSIAAGTEVNVMSTAMCTDPSCGLDRRPPR